MSRLRRTFGFVSLFVLIGLSGLGYQLLVNKNHSGERTQLLEVIKVPFGPIYPPEKTLVLRIFSNREIELDYYEPSNRKRFPFQSEIKTSKITQEQFEEIKELLTELGGNNKKIEYSPTQKMLDASIEVTVNYQINSSGHQIILRENDSTLHRAQYPTALSHLMYLVQKINQENLEQMRKQRLN